MKIIKNCSLLKFFATELGEGQKNIFPSVKDFFVNFDLIFGLFIWESVCTENSCPEGFYRKSINLQCGFCSVEECCFPDEPDMTCHNQQVGCGFGWKHKDIERKTTECSTCAHNDILCCERNLTQICDENFFRVKQKNCKK